jgi:hypothetical protein
LRESVLSTRTHFEETEEIRIADVEWTVYQTPNDVMGCRGVARKDGVKLFRAKANIVLDNPTTSDDFPEFTSQFRKRVVGCKPVISREYFL